MENGRESSVEVSAKRGLLAGVKLRGWQSWSSRVIRDMSSHPGADRHCIYDAFCAPKCGLQPIPVILGVDGTE
jgi:hypothetical protein